MSRLALIWAIVAKDLRAFARDKLWIVLTPFSLAFVAAGYWLAPAVVHDTVWVGFHPPESALLLQELNDDDSLDDGFVLVPFADEARLVAAMAGELEDATEVEQEVTIGLSFPVDFADTLRSGEPTTATLYLEPGVPEELHTAFAAEMREIAFSFQARLTGRDPATAFPATFPPDDEAVLGIDRAGAQVPMRDKLRPMLAILILMLSSIAIAGLVASELERRTVTALLVTPARTADVLAAKAITGTLLGASQALVFLLITWSVGPNWLWISALMLLGALLMASLGMIAGTAGRDFMTTMFLAVALIIPAAIPTFSLLFPGSAALWVQVMPTWGFVEAMVGLMGYGLSPAEVAGPVALTGAWTAAAFGIALLLLKRRVEAL